MGKKTVSIAMPIYNNGSFVSEAIESCLSQSFQDFEICIADDCSTDNSVDIIRKYMDRYPDKIKLCVQDKNMGRHTIAINVNQAFDMCEGRYIAILEGDDVMLPNRLEEQLEFLENNPDCIAATHQCEVFDSQTAQVYKDFFRWLNTKNRTTAYLIKFGNHVHTPTVMFRNLPQSPFRVNPSIKKMVDWYFFIEMSMHGKIGHQDRVLTRYRRHSTNISRSDFVEDILLTLALVEGNYPQYISEVQQCRAYLYFSQLRKKRDIKYLKAMFTINPPVLANALLSALIEK